MFGCVFFHEDTSLSVVGEKSKRLELLGSFQEGEKVNMKWGKDIFSGVIVYVHENQDLLEAEAVKAEKKVLRGKNLSAEESVEQLITFFKKAENENQKKDGKRERIPTERAKESHEQDNEMSPKKKKKNTANEKKDDKTEKKDDGEKNNDEGKKKNDRKKNKAERKKKTEEKSKEKTELETPKEKERHEKKAESSVQLATAKEMLSSLSDQFGSPTASEDRCVDKTTATEDRCVNNTTATEDRCVDNTTATEDRCADNTSLTSTWALCNPELERPSVTMSTTVPSSEATRPPADVLELFKLMLRPQVQSYMRSMISQFQETESQVDETYSCLPLPTYTPMTTWTQDCNFTQPSPWTQQLPVPAFEQQLQTQPTSNIQHTQQMPIQQISLNSQPQDIENQQMSTHLSMPPQISLQQIPGSRFNICLHQLRTRNTDQKLAVNRYHTQKCPSDPPLTIDSELLYKLLLQLLVEEIDQHKSSQIVRKRLGGAGICPRQPYIGNPLGLRHHTVHIIMPLKFGGDENDINLTFQFGTGHV
ncbi:uncharacterized protein LOC134232703 [Saccostrea cucullata]|uniref:uncharacterized protein LOC134232703 n=1 Tax=Saccostrea cuccullata TaxID=36930 RepID=UPI002ED6113F